MFSIETNPGQAAQTSGHPLAGHMLYCHLHRWQCDDAKGQDWEGGGLPPLPLVTPKIHSQGPPLPPKHPHWDMGSCGNQGQSWVPTKNGRGQGYPEPLHKWPSLSLEPGWGQLMASVTSFLLGAPFHIFSPTLGACTKLKWCCLELISSPRALECKLTWEQGCVAE